jgi:hypothetical protein
MRALSTLTSASLIWAASESICARVVSTASFADSHESREVACLASVFSSRSNDHSS